MRTQIQQVVGLMCPSTLTTIVSLIYPMATVEGALGFWRSKCYICHSLSRVLLTHQQPTAIFDLLTLVLAKGRVTYCCAFLLQGVRLVLLCPLLQRPKSVGFNFVVFLFVCISCVLFYC